MHTAMRLLLLLFVSFHQLCIKSVKIFNVGLPRTGTTSFHYAGEFSLPHNCRLHSFAMLAIFVWKLNCSVYEHINTYSL